MTLCVAYPSLSPAQQDDTAPRAENDLRDLESKTSDDSEEPLVVELEDYRDPLEPVNRVIFRFNDIVTRHALAPLAKAYNKGIPKPARKSVRNFFHNLQMPVRAVNHLIQGKPKKSGTNLARFAVNTTWGVLGLFDPATNELDMPKEETDFESTLARYGFGYGVYLQIPFFGPSDLRNGSGLLVDYFLHPYRYLADSPETEIAASFDFFQRFAPLAERYPELWKKADDPYEFFRNLYLQGTVRNAIYGGDERPEKARWKDDPSR